MFKKDPYKELTRLIGEYEKFKKQHPDFMRDYQQYKSDIEIYKKHKNKEEQIMSHQEQFHGTYCD